MTEERELTIRIALALLRGDGSYWRSMTVEQLAKRSYTMAQAILKESD